MAINVDIDNPYTEETGGGGAQSGGPPYEAPIGWRWVFSNTGWQLQPLGPTNGWTPAEPVVPGVVDSGAYTNLGTPPVVEPTPEVPEDIYAPQPPAAPTRVPGTTDYPLPGGRTFFEYPDFNQSKVDYPGFVPPTRKLGAYTRPAEFAYAGYEGPTTENFRTDPGYEFRSKEGMRAIQNAASANGLLSTGGTLKELMHFGSGLASQEFGNIDTRNFRNWSANRDNAFGAWDANRVSGLDEYKVNDANEDDAFTQALTTHLTGYGRATDDWNRGLTSYQTNLGKELAGYGLNLDTANLNLSRDMGANTIQNGQFNNLFNLAMWNMRNMPTYTPTI